MSELIDKIKAYAVKSRPKCFALGNWSNLNAKNYRMIDMLECIYNAAGGSFAKMDDIIDHLTAKNKVFGRTQYTSNDSVRKVDIIRRPDKSLELVGYNEKDPLPLKGQHRRASTGVFRKSDGQINRNFAKTEERLYDLGKSVRELFPGEDKNFIEFAMKSIRNFASEKKMNVKRVVNGIRSGKYNIDTDSWKITPKLKDESVKRRVIVIDESSLDRLADEYNMTEQKFHANMRRFISQLLSDPVNAQPPMVFSMHGYNRSRLIKLMIDNGILIRDERISDRDENGEPKTATMMVKFRCPKKNFDRKLQKLYIRMFEKNLPKRKPASIGREINEEGEGGASVCGGATSASSSGQFIQPMGAVQRRKMPTEIEETTTTMNTGEYQYTVPFGGDKETLARKNGVGGSVSVNKA